ncbi:MAG: tRNA (N6-threonylcarbamoyladenosine(37)-N6)-methyltransferase TrmO [Desulfobacteraceae bacterium]|nr:tRNA (N6-threonylcarbamoyladenosine(37)-N6)-methyltransferase TrmO [Desulfobacteraceae bacterium]
MNDITYRPIGNIRTPFKKQEGMPIQPSGAKGVRGTIKLNKDYIGGQKDLEGFSHIILIYHFHLSQGYSMHVTPFLDDQPRGVFATRAPRRPNAVGLSVVKLNGVEEDILEIENVDMIDGTPLLDIKPYVPEFDAQTEVKTGWLAEVKGQAKQVKSDNRFNSSKKV